MTRWNRAGACVLAVCAVAGLGAAGNAGALLIDAVKAGDDATVTAQLKRRGVVNAAEEDGTTALHWAVRKDNLAMAGRLLRAGADARRGNRYGVQPLMLAATNGNAAMIQLLLEAGADPNAALLDGGETVLMTAARTGRPEAVKALLAAGANPNGREREFGETALIWAATEDRGDVVRLLVANGADINGRSAKTSFDRERQGQSVLPKGSWTPLMYAAREGARAAALALAEGGADLNLQAPDGATALQFAILNAHYDLAALLLEKGADPNVADVSGMGALYAAVDMNTLPWGHGRAAPKFLDDLDGVGLIRRLLDAGADPNAALKAPRLQRHHTAGDRNLGQNATPLMRAAKAGDIPVMKLLLERGANPRATLKDGTNLFMIAAGMGWRGGFDTLRDPGTEEGAIEAMKLCLELGFDVNATNASGMTALHGAVDRGPSVLEFLARHGANLDAKDGRGRTPLDIVTAIQARAGRTNQAAGEATARVQQTDHVGGDVRDIAAHTLRRLAAEAAQK